MVGGRCAKDFLPGAAHMWEGKTYEYPLLLLVRCMIRQSEKSLCVINLPHDSYSIFPDWKRGFSAFVRSVFLGAKRDRASGKVRSVGPDIVVNSLTGWR